MNIISLVRAGLLALLFVCASVAMAQTPTTTSGGLWGAAGTGGTICGGLLPNGQLQPSCGSKSAVFESDAVGECPEGTFFDIGKWSCWKCPTGYIRAGNEEKVDGNNEIERYKAMLRALVPVDGPRACLKRNPAKRDQYGAATHKGRVCPEGSFFDPTRDGECWSCPKGYERTVVPVEWADACVLPAQESFSRVTRHDKATGLIGTDCPQGQFWDAKDGHCYACPSGHNRTLWPVDNIRACVKTQGATVSKATLTGKAVCKPGEFGDPRNGGECWSCPTNFDRTLFPVTDAKSCEIAGGWDYATATQSAALTCAPGQIFDLVNAKHPNIQNHIRAKFGSNTPKNLGGKGGGTCWSCPTGYRRTISPVWDGWACESNGVDWKVPEYRQPGLFGLKGGETVVKELIAERTTIEKIARGIAEGLGKSEGPIIRDAWEEVRDTPEQSGILTLAVYARLQAAANNPARASAAERQLLASFAEAVVAHKTFLADQSLRAYRAWEAADRKKNEVYSAVMVAGVTVTAAATSFGATAGIYAMGVEAIKNDLWPVPDFTDITMRSIIEDQIKGKAYGFIYTKVVLNKFLMKQLFPASKLYGTPVVASWKVGKKALTEATDAFEKKLGKYIAQKITGEVAKGATKLTSKAVLKALMSAGPQIMLDMAIDTIIAYIELQIERANAVPRLEAFQAEAKRPFEIERLLTTTQGEAEVEAQWGTITAGANKPNDAKAISAAADAIIATLAPPVEEKPGAWSGASPQVAIANAQAAIAAAAANAAPRFDILSNGMMCVQAAADGALTLLPCGRPQPTHWMSAGKLLKVGSIEGKCLTNSNGKALAASCDKSPAPAQQWDYQGGQIVSGNVCLEATRNTIAVGTCNPANPNQKWRLNVLK